MKSEMSPIPLLLLTVAVAHASVSVTRTSNDGPHPSTMEIAVALPDSNNNILIPLTRTDAFEDIPITLLDNGVSRTFSSRQVHHPSHSHYRDIDTKSVISVRHVNGKRQISGHVMHEGASYFLEPVGESEHRVVKNVMKSPVLKAQIDSADQVDLGKLTGKSREKRQTITSLTTNVVEIHLLLDSTVWSAFTAIYGSETVALTELHFYYTHILNGMDTTYRNMGSPSISISCIGLTISKNSADDAWMPAGVIEGGAILKALTTYKTGKVGDHFMAFTRKDIAGGGNFGVCGMAFVSGVCKAIGVSINEDMGLHSWGISAHELGHNMGSQHDGSGNTCNASQHNVMGAPTLYSLSNVENSYQFSSCSKNYMAAYINSLGTSNCLRTAEGTRLLELTSDQRQGARMVLNQVCRLTYLNSPGKFFLTLDARSNPASICAVIYCQISSGGGTALGGLRAPVGTPCGSQKSCNWNGQCTYDATAPVANDACFWGDSWAAKNCENWKSFYVRRLTKCKSSVKSACCKTLADVKECDGVR